MNFEETFGDTVRKLRENRNLTLRQVAEELLVDTSMLGKIEKNSRKPTKELIDKFAKFFKVSGKDLKIAFLSDAVAHKIMNEDNVSEVLKVAGEKVKYFRAQNLPNQ